MNDQLLIFLATAIPFAIVTYLIVNLWLKDRKELAEVRDARARAEAEVGAVRKANEDVQKSFESLAAEALKSNSTAFLDLAKRELERSTKDATVVFGKETSEVKKLIDPLQKALDKYEVQVAEIERRRRQDYGKIEEQLEGVISGNKEVARQAEGLKSALRRPHVRGHWGEIQLKNCIELAGMSEYCDLMFQESSRTAEGNLMRPDMTVRMPAGRVIYVDAKVALGAFDQYIEAQTDDERRAALESHGRHVRTHVERLAKKEYWTGEDGMSPDFVVMFLPNESFLYAALETQNDLIEFALNKRVLVASPPNLVGLLKVIYYGWQEQRLAEDAKKIYQEGKELHKRIADLSGNFVKLDQALHKAREAYDAAAYNLDSRVLSSARRLEAMGAKSERAIADMPISSLPPAALDAAVIEVEPELVLENEAIAETSSAV